MMSLLLALAVMTASTATADPGSLRPAQPGSPRVGASASRVPGGNSFQTFTDQVAFDNAVGDPGALALEDFEGGTTPPGGIDICHEPVSSQSNDTCFTPGELIGGFNVTSSEGDGIVVLGAGFLGDNQTSTVIGANIYAEWTVVTFTAPVIAVSVDLYSGRGLSHSPVTVEAFDVYGTSLGSASVTPEAADMKAFLGLVSGIPIARITIAAADNGGEMFDNLQFGRGDSIFADGFDGG